MSEVTKAPDLPRHEFLSDALAAAQLEFAPVVKDKVAKVKSKKTGPDGKPIEFKYTYADLSDVIEAVTPALSKHGLTQLQRFRISGNHQTLVTELRFKTEVIESEIIIPVTNMEPQEVGKIITYFRRYALQALLGITAERDEDAADTGHVRQPSSVQTQRPAPRAPGARGEEPHDPETGEIGGPAAAASRQPDQAGDDRGRRTYPLNGKRHTADEWIVEADRMARGMDAGKMGGFLASTKATRNEIYKHEAPARARLMALSEDLKARALGAVLSEGASQ